MSFFPALWNVPASGSVPGTVTEIYSGIVHPQGTQAAPVGSFYVNTATGALYRKLAGGSTAFGWYLAPDQDRLFLGFQPRAASGTVSVQGINAPAYTGNPTTVLNGPPFPSGGVVADPNALVKGWTGGYTTGVANNVWLFGPSAVTAFPGGHVGGGFLPVDFFPFDMTWEVLTTPRTNNAAGATTLAGVRLMCGIVSGNAAVQLSGGLGNSDTLYTEFATALGVNAGLFGGFFRFSTAVPDPGWVFVTANDNGAVAAQTVTDLGVPIAVDTIYRLRARYQVIAGVPTFLVSVNDGTEIAITANVGPGSTPAGAGVISFLVPYLTCRTLAAAAKSFAWSQFTLTYGEGNEP